uniref:Protein ENL-like n=1 Tax=Cicer arietinum TaxID=3827 RepID=A0A1S2Z4F9_CICAR|nr:protein ENL-like [Cicer arietinum]
MARVKQTARRPSISSKSISLDSSSTSSGRTLSPSPPPPPSPLAKRVSIPTHKVLAKDKGKVVAINQEPSKKRKAPQLEKLMGDAMKGATQKKKKPSSPPKKVQPSKEKQVEVWTRAPSTADQAQPSADQAQANAQPPAQSETSSEIMTKLLEFMKIQVAHNERVEASLRKLQSTLNSVVQDVDAIQEHLGLKMSFEDIAEIGRQSTEDPNPVNLDGSDPPGEETPAEVNTAVSPSPAGDNEDQP